MGDVGSSDTIKRSMPANSTNQRGAIANHAGGGGVDSFLDNVERTFGGASDNDNAMNQKRQLPPPRQQQFNEDDYNSLVAELELPAPKQAPAIRKYVPKAVVAPTPAPVVERNNDAQVAAVQLGVASNKQAPGGGKWARSPAQVKADLEAAQAKADADARIAAQRAKDGLGAIISESTYGGSPARPAVKNPSAAIGANKASDVDLGDLLDEFTKESYRRSELVSQAKGAPVAAQPMPAKPTRAVGKSSVDNEFDSLVADLAKDTGKSSSQPAPYTGNGAAAKAKQASLENVLDSLLTSLDDPAPVPGVRTTQRQPSTSDSDELLYSLLSEIDTPKPAAQKAAPAGYSKGGPAAAPGGYKSAAAPSSPSQYGKTPLPPGLLKAAGGAPVSASSDTYQPLPGLQNNAAEGYRDLPNVQKPANGKGNAAATAYKAPAVRIPAPTPAGGQYGQLPPPPGQNNTDIIYDKAFNFGNVKPPPVEEDDGGFGDDDDDPLHLLDQMTEQAEEDYVEHKKMPLIQEDPAEATALEDLLGALDIAAGNEPPPGPGRNPSLATMDDDDEREIGIPKLTPQQAKVEMEQLQEFRTLGLMSEAEFNQKRKFLLSIINGDGGGGGGEPRIKSERTQAADVVDELLAELM
jgi:hypothetical protein